MLPGWPLSGAAVKYKFVLSSTFHDILQGPRLAFLFRVLPVSVCFDPRDQLEAVLPLRMAQTLGLLLAHLRA